MMSIVNAIHPILAPACVQGAHLLCLEDLILCSLTGKTCSSFLVLSWSQSGCSGVEPLLQYIAV